MNNHETFLFMNNCTSNIANILSYAFIHSIYIKKIKKIRKTNEIKKKKVEGATLPRDFSLRNNHTIVYVSGFNAVSLGHFFGKSG